MTRRARVTRDSIGAALEHGVDIDGRRVFLHGDIDEGSIGRAVRGLYMLSDLEPSKRIELYVSSYGGDLDDAYALHDVITTCDAPVHTIALGKCMSAAPLLVACGAKGQRWATENTVFMLHPVSLVAAENSAVTVAAQAAAAEASQQLYARHLGGYTLKPAAHWARRMRGPDVFFDARQALEWGLVDAIWTGTN